LHCFDATKRRGWRSMIFDQRQRDRHRIERHNDDVFFFSPALNQFEVIVASRDNE
jgi:hypothetical protein